MRITREVRFSLTADEPGGSVRNSWAGWPTHTGLTPYLLLRATVEGPVDPKTGYLCNITVLDRAVRVRGIPRLREAWLETPVGGSGGGGGVACERVLGLLPEGIASELPVGVRLARLELAVTPFLRYATCDGDSTMLTVTQSFEFSAAHRLYCEQLDEAANRELFGKCTNPSGHGHNYILEVTVAGKQDGASGRVIDVEELERVVKAKVIDVFDHKHLNEDCAEFAALNPTVENITRVIWDKLSGCFGAVALSSVRLYETPKTWAEYRG